MSKPSGIKERCSAMIIWLVGVDFGVDFLPSEQYVHHPSLVLENPRTVWVSPISGDSQVRRHPPDRPEEDPCQALQKSRIYPYELLGSPCINRLYTEADSFVFLRVI